jgi:hypothetical protein
MHNSNGIIYSFCAVQIKPTTITLTQDTTFHAARSEISGGDG